MNGPCMIFEGQNFDEFTVVFIGKVLQKKDQTGKF